MIPKSVGINTRNICRGRFAFVDIFNDLGWGNPILLSVSHSLAVQNNAKFTVMILIRIARLSQQPATYLYTVPLHVYPNSFS